MKWNDKNSTHLLLSYYTRDISHRFNFLFLLPSKGGRKQINKSTRIPVLETKTAFILERIVPKRPIIPYITPVPLISIPLRLPASAGVISSIHSAKIAGASGRARAPG